MSEKRLIAIGAVTRCPLCVGVGQALRTDAAGFYRRAEMCARCLGRGNIVRFEAYEKAKV